MALAAAAAFVGAFVQSATGFGFALILSPALFATMEPVEAVTALLLLGLVLNVLVLFERGHVDWRALAPLLLAALPGLAVGIALLTWLSKSTLQVVVGIAVIVAAGWQLRRRRHPAPARLASTSGWAAGLASGVLSTSISVSGPPIVLWLEARGVRPEEFRATLAASFLALNLAGGVVLLIAKGSGGLDLGEVGWLLGLVVIGYALGAYAFRRIDHERFFAFVLVLVAGTGAASVVAGLAG
jgi:uncharacterized membrane protein YfcA